MKQRKCGWFTCHDKLRGNYSKTHKLQLENHVLVHILIHSTYIKYNFGIYEFTLRAVVQAGSEVYTELAGSKTGKCEPPNIQ